MVEKTNPLGNRQKGKLATEISRQNSSGNEGETAQLHCESMRSLPSHNNKENLIATTGNVLLINLRIWQKIPCTLQRNTRAKAHYFHDNLSRDSERP